MFWGRKKGSGQDIPAKRGPSFQEAKEATRRAVFLNTAGRMTTDAAYKQGLAELFQACRTEAIRAGAAAGVSEADIDRELSLLCDADVARLKAASDGEFRHFAQELRDVVNRFLETLQ
jgi:hypothetical protein